MKSLDTWTDEQLALEARAGSSVCFETLVRRYQVRLVAFAGRSVPRADAEDITQDAFVQALLNLDRYDPRWRFKTWLFVIAQRLTIDLLRRRGRRRTAREVHEADSVSTDAIDDRLERDEQAGSLWAIVRTSLGEEPLRAVWLHYVEDMNTRDIARVMGRSWVWVKTTLHRARRKLAPVLSDAGFAAEPDRAASRAAQQLF